MSNDIQNLNFKQNRLDYIDFCKVLAIFLVTVSHCAQQISGSKYPDFMFSKDSFISVNMAIFMIASGFVMNIDKMRQTNAKDFLISKAIRLLLPMTSWYMVMCIVSFQMPRFPVYWSIYWYLGALFVCLSTIKILSCLISSNLLVCIMSILILTSIPMISFERSCYMIPFIWVGFLLRQYINRIGRMIVFFLLISFTIMYCYWDNCYSIYMSPFHIWDVNYHSIFALVFRFLIGVVGGILIISFTKLYIKYNAFGWMRHLSKYGPYTLTFYTMSFVLNAILARVLWHVNIFITTPGLLDIVSIAVAFFMMIIMYYFQIILKMNRWTRLIFLGEM